MKSFWVFLFLFTVGLTNCSRGVEVSSDHRKADKSRTGSTINADGNGNQTPGKGLSTDVGNLNASNNSVVPGGVSRNSKLDPLRGSGVAPAPEEVDLEALLKRSTRPAPEGSTFAVALGSKVVERRTFLRHPVLAKVEKVIDGDRSSVKVFTTDGRVIELAGNAVADLSIVPSAAILQAAGLQPQETKVPNSKPRAADRN